MFRNLRMNVGALAAAAALVGAGSAVAQVSFVASYDLATQPSGSAPGLSIALTNNSGVQLSNGAFNYTAPPGMSIQSASLSGPCTGFPFNFGSTPASLTVSAIRVDPGTTCTFTPVFNPPADGDYGISPTTLTYTGADGASPRQLTSGANPSTRVGLIAAVPTLSEWALILFGLILAGGAALYIQRRQMAV